MMPSPDLNAGLDRVFNYDNIAIVVLLLCLCFSGLFNIVLLRALLGSLSKGMQTITNLSLSINTLNERLGKHD